MTCLLSAPDKSSFEAAVNNGKLAGTIKPATLFSDSRVLLRDTSANIADFVASNDAAFAEPMLFVRAK